MKSLCRIVTTGLSAALLVGSGLAGSAAAATLEGQGKGASVAAVVDAAQMSEWQQWDAQNYTSYASCMRRANWLKATYNLYAVQCRRTVIPMCPEPKTVYRLWVRQTGGTGGWAIPAARAETDSVALAAC